MDKMPFPEPAVEHALAARLLGMKDDLQRRILEAVVGRPRRYTDLKSMLGGRGDHALTEALGRLRRDGLIGQGFDPLANVGQVSTGPGEVCSECRGPTHPYTVASEVVSFYGQAAWEPA